jgi:hypothetical protein
VFRVNCGKTSSGTGGGMTQSLLLMVLRDRRRAEVRFLVRGIAVS